MKHNKQKSIEPSYSRNTKDNLSILIVDDEEYGVVQLESLLVQRGYTVKVVEEGPRCITLCENNIYDVIFMDYHMDGLDGKAVIDIIRSNKVRSTIFVYTGDRSESCIETFKDVYCDAIIFKPLNEDLLNELMFNIELDRTFTPDIVKIIKKKANDDIIFICDTIDDPKDSESSDSNDE